GNDVGKVRQTAIRQVSRELCEGNDILSLDGAIDYIGVVNERVVAARIRVNVGSEIAYIGQAFRVRFPRFSSRTHSPNEVVIAEYAGASVVGGEELPTGEHQVVGDRVMGVGVILKGQSITAGQ